MDYDNNYTKVDDNNGPYEVKNIVSLKKLKSQVCTSIFTTTAFLGVLITGAYYSNSVAIITESARLTTDLFSLIATSTALNCQMKQKSKDFTYGYFRAEVIATSLNIIVIFTVTLWIMFLGYLRIKTEGALNSKIMLISATLSFFLNLYLNKQMMERGSIFSRKLLNTEAVARRNLTMSITVVVISFVVFFVPDYWMLDPIYTFVFALFVFISIKPIVVNCTNILMEGIPSEIDAEKLIQDIRNLSSDIQGVQDFHVWTISPGKNAMSAHVDCSSNEAEVRR